MAAAHNNDYSKMEEHQESATATENSHQEFSLDLLRVYYNRLFPYQLMFRWLSYGNDPAMKHTGDSDYFSRREWSFTLEDDIYVRYLSFRDAQEFMQAIQRRQPHKIDIGAIFNHNPKEHASIRSELFKPEERELVFDIDMTDYDDIRVCCSGAAICSRCWPFMTMAIKVIDVALRQDFNFSHILWVYSGRRGVHCWVCDPLARHLTNDARGAIVEYLSVHVSKDNSDKKGKAGFNHPFHPMIQRAYNILEPMFERYIANETGQGLLSKDRYIKVLNDLPCETIRKELYDQWTANQNQSGADRWRQLVRATTEPTDIKVNLRKKRVNYIELEGWRYSLVFHYCYARLDANVSKTQNHLLKSPFCVHPKTGRVCIPIDPQTADQFDPFTVPTVRSLCAEIDAFVQRDEQDENNPQRDEMPDIKKTSLQASIDLFDRVFMRKLQSTIRKEQKLKFDEMQAERMDF